MNIDIVIPTLNAESTLSELLTALAGQTEQGRILVVDSSSTDRTVPIAEAFGAKVISVPRSSFDHGCTRNEALRHCEQGIAVFFTQDAIPSGPDAIERLINAFLDGQTGAAYGRQLPRRNAGPVEAHARLFNYPQESTTKTLDDAPRLGIKTAFISNSFAAYRREALQAVGGFPCPVILSEDTCVAARMLLSGLNIAYRGDACVYHSHPYSYAQEFRRYFDTGVFHAREPWIRERFGEAEGEGMRFVRSEIRYLRDSAPWLIPSVMIRTFCKYLGYRLGTSEHVLPIGVKRLCSMNKGYWGSR